MLGHKRIPSREGGVEIVIEELTTRMVEQGCFDAAFDSYDVVHIKGKDR